MKKVGLMDINQALVDPRFRDSLPLELKEDVIQFLQNPSCACNVPFYRKLIKNYRPYLTAYFPGVEIMDEAQEVKMLAENNWRVINCSVKDLEIQLRNLGPGRKQIAVARWEDQATVVVNELDVLF